MSEQHNGWSEYKREVIHRIKTLEVKMDKFEEKMDKFEENMEKRINQISIDVSKLKLKSSLWGSLAGLITTLTTILIMSK